MMKKGFSLIEVLTSLFIIGIIIINVAAIFFIAQNSWITQKDRIRAIRDAFWAFNFLTYELREATNLGVNPNSLRFYLDTDGDSLADIHVQYRWNNNQLRRRQRTIGGRWRRWEILINDLSSFSIQNPSGNFYRIQTSITKRKKTFNFRTGVLLRNQ
ncbi:MAG: hypothetical protein DRP76_00610 [Candidatus Omnitrophota bacterium]|nr:MAG: hypothetical protein DRP76_00610 [Candidatus Omnitrophota bacterium]